MNWPSWVLAGPIIPVGHPVGEGKVGYVGEAQMPLQNQWGQTDVQAGPEQNDFQNSWGLYSPEMQAGDAKELNPLPARLHTAIETAPLVKTPEESGGHAAGLSPVERGNSAGRSAPNSRDLSRYSLWKQLDAKPVLPPNEVMKVSLEQAMTQSRADYAHRILGADENIPVSRSKDTDYRDALAPQRHPLGQMSSKQFPRAPKSPAFGSLQPSLLAARPSSVFVELELHSAGLDARLSPAASGDYHETVSQLSRAAGFIVDDRFPAVLERDLGRVHVWGWIPPQMIEAAIHAPFVARVQIENASALPSDEAESKTNMVLAVRIPPHIKSAADMAETMNRLFAKSEFQWQRIIGIQPIPNSNEQALVIAGLIPVRNLDRLLEDPAIVEVMPSPDVKMPVRRHRLPPASPESSASLTAFVYQHQILIMTGLLLLFSLVTMRSRGWIGGLGLRS